MQTKYGYWAAILILTAAFAVYMPKQALAVTDPCASGGDDASFDATVTTYRNGVAQQTLVAAANANNSIPTAPASSFQSNCLITALDNLGNVPSLNNPLGAIESAAKSLVGNLESQACGIATGMVSQAQNSIESVASICLPFPNPSLNGFTLPTGSCFSIGSGGTQLNFIQGFSPPAGGAESGYGSFLQGSGQ